MPRLPSADDFGYAAPSPARRFNEVTAAQESTAPAKFLSGVAQLAEQEADKLAEASADIALNKLREKRLELTLSPDKGFSRLEGSAVVDRPVVDEFPQQFQQELEVIGAGLRGSVAKSKYQQRAAAELSAFKGDVYKHVAVQTDKHYETAFRSSVDVAVKYADSGKSDEAMTLAQGAVVKEMERRGITNANERQVFEMEYLGAVKAATLQGMLTRGETSAATEYFDAHKDSMSAKQTQHFAPIVKAKNDWMMATTLAESASGMEESEALKLFRKESKGSKEIYESAKGLYADGRSALHREDENRIGTFHVALSQSPTRATFNRLLTEDAYLNASPAAQGRIQDYARSLLEHQELLAKGRRAEAEHKQNQKFLMNPGAIAAFGQVLDMIRDGEVTKIEQVYAYAPAIGQEMTSKAWQVMHEQQSGAKAFKIKISDDMLPDAIRQGKANEDARDTFKGLVGRALIDWKAQNPGKVPSDDDQMKIVRSANAEHIQINRFLNETVPAYNVKPDMKTVPKEFYDGAKAWAAKNGKQLTDAQILEKYQLTKVQ